MSTQIDLFRQAKVEIPKPEPLTRVTLGKRSAQIPLRKKRRAAIARLMEILKELEGKTIYVGSYDAGGRHFWLNNLKIEKLALGQHPNLESDYIPSVIVLYGRREACVRIFTDYLVNVRTQEYLGYWLHLLDFRNGFYESRIDPWKSHYACLHITRFKD